MMNRWLKLLNVMIVVLTVGALTLYTMASAQEPDKPESAASTERQGWMKQVDIRGQMKAALADALGILVEELEASRREGIALKALAEAEGVSMTELRAAMKAAREAAIDQALADGVITEAQAERLRAGKRIRRVGLRQGPMRNAEIRMAIREAVTETLGLSLDALKAARADGQTLPQIAEAQGVEMSVLQTAVQTAAQAAIDQAVADGTLTQAQADRLSERLARRGAFAGRGFRGKFGKFHNPDAQLESQE